MLDQPSCSHRFDLVGVHSHASDCPAVNKLFEYLQIVRPLLFTLALSAWKRKARHMKKAHLTVAIKSSFLCLRQVYLSVYANKQFNRVLKIPERLQMIRNIIFGIVGFLFLLDSPGYGDVVVDIQEVGGDVIVNGAGTIDLTELSLTFSNEDEAVMNPAGYLTLGPATATPFDVYGGTASGPAGFGGNLHSVASIGSGDFFGLAWQGSTDLILPSGYVSGTFLSGSSTYSGQTFDSLLINPGSYVWTIGDNAFTINAIVPEPNSIAIFGMTFVGFMARRRR